MSASKSDRYNYGSLETKFRLLNFHPRELVESIAKHLLSGRGEIEVVGQEASGRSYLVEAAAFEASMAGKETRFVPIEQAGYEPGASFASYLNFQLNHHSGYDDSYLEELHKEFKGVLDMPPLDLSSMLGVSLGLNLELPVKFLLMLVQGTSAARVPGATLSAHERLRNVLDQTIPTQKQVVLYFRDGLLLNDGLRRMLMDEAALRPGLFVASAYSATPAQSAKGIRVFVRPWTEEELWARVTGRFRPNKFPNDFRKFAWNSAAKAGSGPGSNRGAFATVMLRLLKLGKLSQGPQGWTLPRHWERDEDIVGEFCRDLYSQILDALGGLPVEKSQAAELWLQMAAMCHPTIPVNLIAEGVGIPMSERDAFVEEVVEGSLGLDGQVALLRDLEFLHPGFFKEEPLYEFLNPIMPEVILRRVSEVELERVAARLLHLLDESRSQKSAAWVRLRLRIVSNLGLSTEKERMENTLGWWVDQGEADSLRHYLAEAMERGEVSPQAIWNAVKSERHGWPPHRRYALLRAFGEQPEGVPEGSLVDFWIEWSLVAYQAERYKESIQVGEMALGSGKLGAIEQALIRTSVGHSHFAERNYTAAQSYFKESLNSLLKVLGARDIRTLVLMNDLAVTMGKQAYFTEATTMLQKILDLLLGEVSCELQEKRAKTLGGLRIAIGYNLASVLMRTGQVEQAEQVVQAHVGVDVIPMEFLSEVDILLWPGR